MNKNHELKCWPMFFRPIVEGMKTFDIRLNDRGFQVGDTVLLREWDNRTGVYTGNTATFRIGYLMDSGVFPFPEYVILSIIDLRTSVITAPKSS